ncbi:MAG: superinfection immunity protein [Verrucomicrobiota bacterium]
MATPSRRSARPPEPFLPDWGYWLIGSVLLCLLLGFLKISGLGAALGASIAGLSAPIDHFTSHLASFINGIIWPVILLILYFLPYYICGKSKRSTAIFVANLVFGWTIIGWFIVLIWALAERGSLENSATPTTE